MPLRRRSSDSRIKSLLDWVPAIVAIATVLWGAFTVHEDVTVLKAQMGEMDKTVKAMSQALAAQEQEFGRAISALDERTKEKR